MSREHFRYYSYRRPSSKGVNMNVYELVRLQNKQKQRKKYFKIFLYISLSILVFLIVYAFIAYNCSIDANSSLYRRTNTKYGRTLSELVNVDYPSSELDNLKMVENDYNSSNKSTDEKTMCKDPLGNMLNVPKNESDSLYRAYNKSMFNIKNIKLEEISLPLSKLELSHIINRLKKDIPKEYLMNLWLQAFAVSNDLMDIVNILNEYIQYYRKQMEKCIDLTNHGNYSSWKKCNVELAKTLLFENIEYNTKFYKVLITRHM